MKINYWLFLVFCAVQSYAQESFKGEALYITQYKKKIQIDSSLLSSNQTENKLLSTLFEKMNQGIQQTYVLKFDKEQSFYKREERLEPPSPDGTRFSADVGFSGNSIYKNYKENRYTIENELYDKLFLIKDTLHKNNWQLENETKKIGNYTCYKASSTITKQVIATENSPLTFSQHGSKNPEKARTKEVEVTIIAWYTPEIPVSAGPGVYHGLPGLILEVTSDTETILCERVIISNKSKFTIKEPKKGAQVNPERFEEIKIQMFKEQKSRKGF